jgi:hypothetical protein
MDPLIAAAILAGLLLAGLLARRVARARADRTFFADYAEARGMTLIHGRSRLPERTPLLRRGKEHFSEHSLLGPLGEGFAGTLALYTARERRSTPGRRGDTEYGRYTLGLVEVPECRRLAPELFCQPRSGFAGFEDRFRPAAQRLELESTVLASRYEIFAAVGQDPIWLRRLFAPSFVAWLIDHPPPGFAFEYFDGMLCGYVPGHRKGAAELDHVALATVVVAARLRAEAAEQR